LKKAVDNPIVDGAVTGVAPATNAFGEFMRATQTGQIQNLFARWQSAITLLLLISCCGVRTSRAHTNCQLRTAF